MNRLKKLLLSFILVSSILSIGFSQNYSVTHFNESNGFNANTVYGINQDSKGFLWIGTDRGLFRYDGNEFKHYGLKDGLTNLDVFNLSLDSQDHILIHDFSNQINFIHNSETKIIKKYDSILFTNVKQFPINIYYKKGDAFLVSNHLADHFFYIKLKNGLIQSKKKIKFKKNRYLGGISIFKDEYIVFLRNSENEKITFYNVYNDSNKLYDDSLHIPLFSNYSSNKKYICISQKKSISFYKKTISNKLIFSHKKSINFNVKRLFFNKNHMWCTSINNGILKISPKNKIEQFNIDEHVNFGFIDRDSNIWVATADNGLYYYKKSGIKNFGINKLKISKSITSLCEGNENNIYLGFNKTSIAEFKNNSIYNFHNLKSKSSNQSSKVIKIIKVNNNYFYCLTDRYLYKIDSKNLKINSKILFPNDYNTFKDILHLGGDSLFLGTSSRLLKILDEKIKIKFPQRVTSFEIDSSKNLWIGSLSGVQIWPNGTKEPIILNNDLLNKRKINDIFFKDEQVFLATDSGIFILDYNSKKIQTIITENLGLTGNYCNKLIFYKQNLWVGTNSGISKINFKKDKYDINNIRRSDGLISNFINDLLILNDTVYVATNEGLSVFPFDYKTPNYQPIINFINATSNEINLDIYNKIILSPKENNISITYSNMMFHNKSEKYEYRLLPINQTWTRTKENKISFSDLSPNDYSFEVRAMGYIDKSNKTTAKLYFEVSPTFFQTFIFKFLLIAITAGLLILISLWRLRIVKRKINASKTITQLELEAIKAQINPHFISNCLSSIKNTIIKGRNMEAEEQISIFANLVRETLEISQQNFISLNKEIEYLTNYLDMEKVRFKEELEFSLFCSKNLNTSSILIPTMLIQPYIENAIKHGNPEDETIPTKIKIFFNEINNKLICEISDNGPGIKLENKNNISHTSMGMKISSDRADKYNELYGMNIITNFGKGEFGGTIVKLIIDHDKD